MLNAVTKTNSYKNFLAIVAIYADSEVAKESHFALMPADRPVLHTLPDSFFNGAPTEDCDVWVLVRYEDHDFSDAKLILAFESELAANQHRELAETYTDGLTTRFTVLHSKFKAENRDTNRVTVTVNETLEHTFTLDVPVEIDSTDGEAVMEWASNEVLVSYDDGQFLSFSSPVVKPAK